MIESQYRNGRSSVGETFMAIAIIAVILLFLGPLNEFADILLLEKVLENNSVLLHLFTATLVFNLFVSYSYISRKLGFKKQGSRLLQLLGKNKRSLSEVLFAEGIALVCALSGYFLIESYFLSKETVLKSLTVVESIDIYLAKIISFNFSLAIFTLTNFIIFGWGKIYNFDIKTGKVPRMPRKRNTICLGTIGEVGHE